MIVPETVLERLIRHNQAHLLRWWDELDEAGRAVLVAQIESVDFDLVGRLFNEHQSAAAPSESPGERARRAVPPEDMVRRPASEAERSEWERAATEGNRLLEAGKVGVILVAGGQGTRLGFNQPKGMFPIGPVSGKTLFQILAEQVLARSRRAGVSIPYCVMTSDATHEATVEFFHGKNHFGLDPADVHFFKQGAMPAVDDRTGKLLLSDKGTLASGPDGHGGMLAALAEAGLLEEMRRRGIEYLFYHQVDNPACLVCDPAFLGFHRLHNSEMSTKVVAKRSAGDKLGVLCRIDGRTQIIEYSDLPDDVAQKPDPRGRLLLWAGNMAIHVFNRTFLERLLGSDNGLPFHVAHKQVPYIDDGDKLVKPAKPNAFKFEKFIFDALPAAGHALVVEADRGREFHPVKNAEGNDSPETCRAALSAIAKDRLREAGATVTEDATIEISPLFALDEEELREKIDPGRTFSDSVYLS